jgi:hypothetical protein
MQRWASADLRQFGRAIAGLAAPGTDRYAAEQNLKSV